jgi:hypothetical protein
MKFWTHVELIANPQTRLLARAEVHFTDLDMRLKGLKIKRRDDGGVVVVLPKAKGETSPVVSLPHDKLTLLRKAITAHYYRLFNREHSEAA